MIPVRFCTFVPVFACIVEGCVDVPRCDFSSGMRGNSHFGRGKLIHSVHATVVGNNCRSAAASSLLQHKGVFERPSIHQESVQRNAQHKSSNKVHEVPPASHPESHMNRESISSPKIDANQRKRTSDTNDTGGVGDAAEQHAV